MRHIYTEVFIIKNLNSNGSVLSRCPGRTTLRKMYMAILPMDADIFPPSDDRDKKSKIFTTNHTNQNEQEKILFKEECFNINSCIYLNYLAVTGFKLGLLVNFNSYPKAEIIRIVR